MRRRAPGTLAAFARWSVAHAVPLLAVSALAGLALGALSADLDERLSNGEVTASGTESGEADGLLAERFGARPPDLLLYARAPGPVDAPGTARAGRELTRRVAAWRGVDAVRSYWTTGRPDLRSKDGRGALITVDLGGDPAAAARTAERLVPAVARRAPPLRVSAAGPTWATVQIIERSRDDQRVAELVVAPLTVVILLIAFRSVFAALVPAVIGVLAVAATLAALRLLSSAMAVPAVAPNLTTALGFGLAIDYSLFLVTRFREEIARGRPVPRAVEESMRSAGRAVLFSAATVAVALSGLLVFPVEALRSLAWTAIILVLSAAASAVVVVPAMLAVIGDRIDRLDPFARLRRPAPRPPLAVRLARRAFPWRVRRARGGWAPFRLERDGHREESAFWRRLATAATRRPVALGGGCALLLVLLAAPFAHARFGVLDERVLPRDAEAHATADRLRRDFDRPVDRDLVVVLPGRVPPERAGEYARWISAVPDVLLVRTATGGYARGERVEAPGPAHAALAVRDATMITVSGAADPQSRRAERLVERVRDLPAPGRRLVTGRAAQAVDTLSAVGDALPAALLVVAGTTLVMLFLFTGGLLASLKALLLGLLSLTAGLGAVVAVYQDGRLSALTGDVAGLLEANTLLLALTVAFGLSIDYEVFLLDRIREAYLATGDHTASVVAGIARTGRLVTAAALIVAVTVGSLVFASVAVLQVNGFALALAVLVDATVVRGLLVPAFMRLTGPANWWAPAPLARLRRRLGLADHPPPAPARPRLPLPRALAPALARRPAAAPAGSGGGLLRSGRRA
ncbi:MMPL family transporter [Bailinhaonella thermotolerans]|uniref:MMPL family transporter n=1 Tax=Bailinhaonella thermotolerans TaxID=1070861 RepID=UPI00192A191B|nr:MMPL family transporter [Bailinhaonella thermotolerans]